MRIFLTLHPSSNLSVEGSMTWYYNLYEPLIEIGHDVVLLRLDEVAKKYRVPFRGKKFKEIYSNELGKVFLKEHTSKPFDIFMSYVTERDVDSGILKMISKKGIPMANFSCNNTHQFYLTEEIAPLFDYNLHSEKSAALKFKESGANPIWFPMAANPKYYYPLKSEHKYDISFIGAAYDKRAYYIHHLIESNISVDCFGPNWLVNKPNSNLRKFKKEISRTLRLLQSLVTFSPEFRLKKSLDIYNYDLLVKTRKINSSQMHYPCSDDEMKKIINQTKINLGFLEVYAGESDTITQQHLHLREFEIPMCGGLYITNYSEELAEFYEPEKEVLTFKNEHELTDKIRYYLNHERESEIIRNSAYRRAINCHTYQTRFSQLFKELNLKKQ